MPTSRARSGQELALPLLWSVLLTAVILGPVLTRPGFVLSYDMVFVPDQPLKPWMWGAGHAPPRAVPQDLYVAVLDEAIPGWLLQRCLLAAAILLAGVGIAVLLRSFGRAGQLVGSTCYVWSAWVFERLVIGHWGLLVAFAAAPWVVHLAVRARIDRSRRAGGALVLVVFAATWVPSGGLMLCALAAAVLVWPGPGRRPWWPLAAVALVQLSWLAPALGASSPPQSAGSLFGLAGDAGSGPVLTALTGSGIWNPATAPSSRSGALLAWIAAGIVVVAVTSGFRPLLRGLGRRIVLPMLLVGCAGLVWAILTGMPAATNLVHWIQSVPGGGLLRDGQKWLAAWWLFVSCTAGAAAAALRDRGGQGGVGRLAGVLVLVPLLLLPDLAGGAGGRLRPNQYPDDWNEVSAILAAADDGTAVASLPWSAFRRYPWNDDHVVLDPAPRYLPAEVAASSDLLLRRPGGIGTLPSDDPADAPVAGALASATPGRVLAGLGVGWLLVQVDQPPGPLGEDLDPSAGATTAYEGQTLRLVQLSGASPAPPSPPFPWPLWLLIGLVVGVAAAAASGRNLRPSARTD